MGCDHDRTELSAWIDGERPEGLEAHLERCETCRQVVEDLRALRAASAGLAETSESDSDAGWARIAARLPQRRAGRRWRPLALAAAAALMLASAATIWIGRRGDEAGSAQRRARVELARLHDQQQRTIAALQAVVRAQRDGWPAGLRQTYSKNLSLVDAAIAECRRALRQHPGDVPLRASLMDAYQRKVELLKLFAGQDEEELP